MSRPRGYGSGSRDSSQIPEPYIFYQFYSASDDPWFPAGVIQPALTQPRSSAPTYTNGSRGFHDFRSPALPSECDTAPEDSGYGGSSRPTYSIVESVASVNENDRCTETGFLETQTAEQLIGIGDLNLTSATPIYKAPEATNAKLHHCDLCGANVKTKSELKKHNHRHNKPYKCSYETCPKAIQGFSTPNDLSRHKRTVHREHNSYGASYICRHDPCINKKEKLWPRADNFRSHLIRAHNIHLKADDDLRYYRHQPGTTRLHELRDGKPSVVSTRSGHRPAQTQHSSAYTCRSYDCSRGKENTWPTANDLLHHLASVHDVYLKPGDDIKHYIYQPEATELHALRGVGSSVADVDPEPRPAQVQDSPDLRSDQVSTTALGQAQNEASEQCSLPPTTPCLLSGDESPLMRSSILDDLKLTPAPDSQPLASDVVVEAAPVVEVSLEESEAPFSGDEPPQENFDEDEDVLIGGEEEALDRQNPITSQAVSPDSPLTESKTNAPQNSISESQKLDDGPDSVSGASTNALISEPDTTDILTLVRKVLLEKIVKDGPSSDVLSLLRDLPKHLLEKALKSEDQTRSGSDVSSDQTERSKSPSQCPDCPKSFSRMCELRKHMKRHDKPYGCTYKTCHKMFGSKNDWKRHESSQHFQMESWNCDMRGCKKVLPRRDLFKTHLLDDHNLPYDHEIENKLESCRLGRHCDPRFWCGFCNQFIEIKEKVVNSWTKRCDHIDNHLFGKEGAEKKNMGDWCYLEDKLGEGDSESNEKLKAAEASSGSAKKRKATDDLDIRPTKRHSFIWFCCLCKHSEGYQTSSRCMEGDCNHQRCSNCVVEQIPDLDHETEPVSQEEER